MFPGELKGARWDLWKDQENLISLSHSLLSPSLSLFVLFFEAIIHQAEEVVSVFVFQILGDEMSSRLEIEELQKREEKALIFHYETPNALHNIWLLKLWFAATVIHRWQKKKKANLECIIIASFFL